ncbi:hypothetical protein Vi05172_g5173 [Venturia inaequalis]|nr:hypothetical protein Vi05172_g5173 [Venturia inaequalis]
MYRMLYSWSSCFYGLGDAYRLFPFRFTSYYFPGRRA